MTRKANDPFPVPEGWERVGESLVASDEKERKAYFQPFSYIDPLGRNRDACGAPRRNCPNCGHRYSKEDRLCLTCPHCGLDRKCRQHAMDGRTRCSNHGSKQLRGPAHGQYKHGKRSMLWGDKLPDGPKQAFRRALEEMDSRNVYVEMATFQARIEQLSSRIAKATDSNAWWIRLGQLEKDVRDAAKRKDQAALDQAMNDILELSRRGSSEAVQWHELLECVTQLAKLKQVQGQIERDNKSYLSMSDAMAIITTMAQSVKEAMVLVRDQWRTFDSMMRADAMRQEVVKLLEDKGADPAFTQMLERLPFSSVHESFVTADRLVQDRLKNLVE